MLVVDTNVLLYAADRDAEAHGVCRELIESHRARPSPWFLTWGICYEFLRVGTHAKVFRKPWSALDAQGFLTALFAAPGLSLLLPTGRHAALLQQTIEELPDLRGNLMHDLHTAVLMREHGVSRIVTRDTDYHRFPFLEVVDPLR